MIILGREINKKIVVVICAIIAILLLMIVYSIVSGSNPITGKPLPGFEIKPSGTPPPRIQFPYPATSKPGENPNMPSYMPTQIIVELKQNINPVNDTRNISLEELLNSNYKRFFTDMNRYEIDRAYQVIEKAQPSDELSRYYVLKFKKNIEDLDLVIVTCRSFTNDVSSCSKDTIAKPYKTFNDPYFSSQLSAWGGDLVEIQKAWDYTSGNVVLGIVDDCFNASHADLSDVYKYASPTWNGSCHGTMTSGVMAARGGNGIGIIGSCPNCEIYAGSYSTESELANSIDEAVRNGAKVMNFSFGFHSMDEVGVGSIGYKAGKRAYDGGMPFFVSAGNCVNGPRANSCDTNENPQAWPFVTLVAASDSSGNRASYSSYSSMVRERGVMAPGTVVTTSQTAYAEADGTSFSSPLTAGVAGLMLSLKSDLGPEKTKDILYKTATDKGPAGPDIQYGFGLINACKALTCVKDIIDGKPNCLDSTPTIHCVTPTNPVDPTDPNVPSIDPCNPNTGGGNPSGGNPSVSPKPNVSGIPLPTLPVNPSATPYPTIGNTKPLPQIDNCDCGWDVWCFLGCKAGKTSLNTSNHANVTTNIPATCVKPKV